MHEMKWIWFDYTNTVECIVQIKYTCWNVTKVYEIAGYIS